MESSPSVSLTLPPAVYAAVGVETGIYFDNIVYGEPREGARFRVHCPLGRADAAHWSVTPRSDQVGEYALAVECLDERAQVVSRSQTRLIVAPSNAGGGTTLRMLIVGDSLTHATRYPNELARLLSQPGNPSWMMLGTHRPGVAAEGVRHEGYGGWTWQAFLARWGAEPESNGRRNRSPFLFAGADGKPKLDLPRYFRKFCDGKPPTVVTFLLGINDCFHVNSDDEAAIDARIDQVFGFADQFLAAFHRAAPDACLGVCLTTPGNARDEAFDSNYHGKYTRRGWRCIQRQLVVREIEHFGGREAEKIHLVPTELWLDTVGGLPDNNAVHPNVDGYNQIAASIYAWLKAMLSR